MMKQHTIEVNSYELARICLALGQYGDDSDKDLLTRLSAINDAELADALAQSEAEEKEYASSVGDDEVIVPCVDGTENHKWVVSDENENICYCERCGCMEY